MKAINKKFVLLGIIYLAFISLGLPDGVLGVAWPAIRSDMGMRLESMGIITTLLLIMSAFSSVVSGRLLIKFGTGGITTISGLMTGLALLGYSIAPSFLWILICTIPLGFGQGAVDSGLNLYVAEHYSARHMNWLHCFWGVGASLGPTIMTFMIAYKTWGAGYSTVSIIQLALSAVLLFSLIVGLWKVDQDHVGSGQFSEEIRCGTGLYRVSDQIMAVLLFFLYSGIEFSVGVWLYSVLVESRNIAVSVAGMSVTSYYASIMAGRFLSGIVVNHFGNMNMIRFGVITAALGCGILGISGSSSGVILGTSCVGLGLAPFYPCLMHETPSRFTKEVFNKLIGYQVGAACLGGSIICAATGVIISNISLELLFPIAIVLLAIAFVCNEILNYKVKK